MSVSYWTETSRLSSPSPVLDLPAEVDVCVVGAGVVGLTTALELAYQGREVLVVDAEEIGFGVTGQSTAKVTVGTGLRLDQIAERHGIDVARDYVDAGSTGLRWITHHLDDSDVRVGESASHDLCATTTDGVTKLRDHFALAEQVGLKVEQVLKGAIPEALHTVRYPDQWMIQPTDYLRLLAARFVQHGGRLALGVAVRSIDGGLPSSIMTDRGTIAADHVVSAAHVPLGVAPAMLPWQQVRHYAAVFETDVEIPMALDIDGGWSVRPVQPGTGPGTTGRRGVALGSEHAMNGDDTTAAGALHRWVTSTWDARIVDTWSSQDVSTDDHLPVVGRIGAVDRVLTATGFGGWGLAFGTAAGLDLAQRLSTDTERWGFWSLTPQRLAGLAPAAATQGAQAAAKLVSGNVSSAMKGRTEADELSPGQGVVVREGTDIVARSIDTDGRTHAVSGRCPHMGCIVGWNNEAQSWDCPCHGSRFSPSGAVLHGPAVEPLAPVAE